MTRHLCGTCHHDFYDSHVDTDRWQASWLERQRRRCSDCIECHPPEDAPVREDVHTGVTT